MLLHWSLVLQMLAFYNKVKKKMIWKLPFSEHFTAQESKCFFPAVCLPSVNSGWNLMRRRSKGTSLFGQGPWGWRTYYISWWHMSHWGMQLFTGHDIIISRSIREAQKNETLGSLASLRKKEIKWNSRWYSSDISSKSTTPCIALPSCTLRLGSSTNLSGREDQWYLSRAVFIIQHNGQHCIYRCCDLCWLSNWQKTQERGGDCVKFHSVTAAAFINVRL